ncbi:hypothetical protein SAICODRAFT_18925 [Saitoella complicata NRRL Y-17804]|uniref:uncharacterized protein n=1 Tax=Saitoella complicata (strain BCRC 22490 / CBS 7301 / JCM 7358 / NBRC 10748 / NRRL Y-17804) TaxID=698492 RepID=UPI000867CC54|nr:uncharacterized protein SAICODRAFT_18925 [Saitoella complicata NRRL Y-17804]ODQ53438.1 hypothetical protein SAICODRAFT_18925 [Saitoella complicata NRRL Y-17804]
MHSHELSTGSCDTLITSFLNQHDLSTSPGTSAPTAIECCCGAPDCASLKSNERVLAGLEKDVRIAAELGQALLNRHEVMVEAVKKLEVRNKELEEENQRTIRENRELLERLESLNNSLSVADSQVESLNHSLAQTEAELARFRHMASRAQTLDDQLCSVELEKSEIQQELEHSRRNERSAEARWHKAQKQLEELQMQMEAMEREVMEEREKTKDFWEKLEEKRKETKLEVVKQPKEDVLDNPQMATFVADLLATNQNLETSTSELRALLSSTQDEVALLREQLLLHQRQEDDDDKKPVSLDKSIGMHMPPRKATSQELHHHHHHYYHLADPNLPPTPGTSRIRSTTTDGVIKHPPRARYQAPGAMLTPARSGKMVSRKRSIVGMPGMSLKSGPVTSLIRDAATSSSMPATPSPLEVRRASSKKQKTPSILRSTSSSTSSSRTQSTIFDPVSEEENDTDPPLSSPEQHRQSLFLAQQDLLPSPPHSPGVAPLNLEPALKRTTSHESFMGLQGHMYPTPDTLPRTEGRLRRVASHESVLSLAPPPAVSQNPANKLLLGTLNRGRRPVASPLQVTSPTNSVLSPTSVMAGNVDTTAILTPAKSTMANSNYSRMLLRSAAGAKKAASPLPEEGGKSGWFGSGSAKKPNASVETGSDGKTETPVKESAGSGGWFWQRKNTPKAVSEG